MDVSLILNRWLKHLYKLLAIFLVCVALSISLFRLTLSYVHHYQKPIEEYLQERLNAKVDIGDFAMGWDHYGPTLIAHQVQLLSEQGTIINIKQLAIELDFWRSIRAWQYVTQDFSIQQAEVVFENNDINIINNAPTDMAAQSQVLERFLSSVLLEQISHFSIYNSHIIYRNKAMERAITISDMVWYNNEHHHQATGKIILDGLSSNYIKVSLDFKGQKFSNFTGQAYLSANEINLAPWLGKTLKSASADVYSSINFNTWLTIDSGNLVEAQTALNHNQLSWKKNNIEQTIELVGGNIQIISTDKMSYKLSTTPITIMRNGVKMNTISLYGKSNIEGVQGYIDNIALASINGVMPLFFDDKKTEELLSDLAPTGQINAIHFYHNKDETVVSAQLDNISNQYSHGVPSTKNVNGEFIYFNNKFHIALNAHNGTLDFAQHFKQPLPYSEILADITGEFSEQQWHVRADNVQLTSADLTLKGNVKINKTLDSPITMTLNAGVEKVDANVIPNYYPQLLMGDDLVSYLNESIIKGTAEQVKVEFNGALARFPFYQNEGVFVVDAQVLDSTFAFDANWPVIENLDAHLNFTNNSMKITAKSGSLQGVDVKGVQATIDDLSSEQVLLITHELTNVEPDSIHKVMNQSPMKSSIGKTLDTLKVTGNVNGAFSLTLPLNDVDKIHTTGFVTLDDNIVVVDKPQLEFTKVSGRLDFDNSDLYAENINILWQHLPLKLKVSGNYQPAHYHLDIDTFAQWSSNNWQINVPKELHKYAQGQFNWQGKLALNINDDDFFYDFKIHSLLNDLSLNIPNELYSKSVKSSALNIHAFGNIKETNIEANLGQHINFYGLLAHKEPHFTLGHLVLGKKQQWLPIEGFNITADIDNADYSQWHPLISDILSVVNIQPSTSKNSEEATNLQITNELPLITIHSINGKVSNLLFYQENFHDIDFSFTPKKNWWAVDINAKEIRGSAKIYPDWYEQGLDINLEFLHLATRLSVEKQTINDNVDQKTPAEATENFVIIDNDANSYFFKHVPPLQVQCGHCKYGKYDFGKVSFDVIRESQNMLFLKNFKGSRGKNKLVFDARWHQEKNYSHTVVTGTYSTNNVEREIENLGYSSIIKDSGVKTSYDVNWLGSPYDFSLKHFDGKLSVNLDDGYLEDVDDQGVRIFSLFSLQSLVRKLSFDFRDIFSDGMFYREFSGDFSFKKGIAYTKNLDMKGSAGDLFIRGNTNLNNGELDFRMSYKPNLTSSLPVLAWIATTNPVTFIAGLALDEVITSSVVSEINFEVSGHVEQPDIKQVSKKNKNVSVGRTTPPKIVENYPDEGLDKSEQKSLKDEGG